MSEVTFLFLHFYIKNLVKTLRFFNILQVLISLAQNYRFLLQIISLKN